MKTSLKKFIFCGAIPAAISFAVPLFAFAAGTITINPNIPAVNPGSLTNPGSIVSDFYQFALMIAGVLALGAIVYGGVKYATSAGNPSAQSEGKEWILSALYGLLLLAGAYIILYTINPNLVNLNPPVLSPVASNSAGTPSTPTNPTNPTSTCPVTPLPTITDPQAQAMENGATVIWTSANSQVQGNLTQLQSEFNKMQSAIAKQFPGISLTVTSVYRPLAYQAYLYDIYQSAQQMYQNPDSVNYPACQSIIQTLDSEEIKHGVCSPKGGPCLVAAPNGCSDHPTGKGIDISVSPSTFYTASNINQFLQSKGINLQWAALANDPVHFRLTNPSFTGCVSS